MLRRALFVAAVAAASAAAPGVANSTVSVAPKNPFFRRSFPVKAAASGSAVGMIASSSAKPQTQLPVAVLPKQTMEEYKTMLTKLIAWKRWKMAYYYLYSTKYTAYVASMPAEVSPEMATLKTYLSKSAIFFDILANYEITGFVWCSLLYTWTDPPPTDYYGAVLYYHSIKTAYSFFTWQWFLLMKDYFALFPDAYSKVDPKFKSFVTVAEAYSCWNAFSTWEIGKYMGIAGLPDATSDLSKAKLSSFFWDISFIKTVKMLVSMTVWGWSYPDQKWLTESKPFIALSLPYIAFSESYYEGSIALMKEAAAKAQAEKENLVEKH